MTELEKWCKDHDLTANEFEQVFGDKPPQPKWVEELYKLGQKSRDVEVLKLQTQLHALQALFANLGSHLHLETKRHWWQRKNK